MSVIPIISVILALALTKAFQENLLQFLQLDLKLASCLTSCFTSSCWLFCGGGLGLFSTCLHFIEKSLDALKMQMWASFPNQCNAVTAQLCSSKHECCISLTLQVELQWNVAAQTWNIMLSFPSSSTPL